MFSKMVAYSVLDFAEAKKATSGALDAVNKVGRGARGSLSHLKGLLGSLDGSERGGVRTGVTAHAVVNQQCKHCIHLEQLQSLCKVPLSIWFYCTIC